MNNIALTSGDKDEMANNKGKHKNEDGGESPPLYGLLHVDTNSPCDQWANNRQNIDELLTPINPGFIHGVGIFVYSHNSTHYLL